MNTTATRYCDDPLDPDTWPDDLTIDDDMPSEKFIGNDAANPYTYSPDPDTLYDPDDYGPDDGGPTSVFVDDDTAEAQVQLDIFAAAGRVDDLPLFSGTAMRAKVQPFVEKEPGPKQSKMEL